MKAVVMAVAVLLGATSPSLAQAQAPVHEHGAAILNVAIEGPVVTLDLALPAADIIGFERPPASDEDFTDIAQARAALQDPFQLVAFPSAAGCAVDSAEVDLVPDLPPRGTAAEEEEALVEEETGDDGAGRHADIVALYQLTCARPSYLTGLAFPVLGLYPGLRSLHLHVITPVGQRRYEVVAGAPEVEFGSLVP